jgi:large subunit ribosomal protein L23
MALLDVFKKKPPQGVISKDEKKPEKKDSVKIVEEKKSAQVGPAPGGEEKAEKPKSGKGVLKKEFSQIAARILSAPHVTEKAMNLGQQNKYIFKVSKDANKTEVKKAIQEVYGVAVEGVNIINIHRRKRIVRARAGFKPGFKKAVVTLRQGDKIDIGV